MGGNGLGMSHDFNTVARREPVVALGASAGGTDALQLILEAMPADAPPMVIVQHMGKGFTSLFADVLNQSCKIEIKRASHGDILKSGLALIAPAQLHMQIVYAAGLYFVRLSEAPAAALHCPSVDVLFRSVARAAGPNALGIILTGMGADGADGLFAMRQAGAY